MYSSRIAVHCTVATLQQNLHCTRVLRVQVGPSVVGRGDAGGVFSKEGSEYSRILYKIIRSNIVLI